MATATTPLKSERIDWRQEWFEFEGATYLNAAAQAPMPKVSLKAVQAATEWKKWPQTLADSLQTELPGRVRASIAKLMGANPDEIALTTGASSGMSIVAYGLDWKPGDEIVTATREFPLQYTTWRPMEEREGVVLKVVKPAEKFIAAEDVIAALTPRTKLVSISLVRFDDGSLLDAASVAKACHAQGALLLLDLSQACGAVPMEIGTLGADFAVCAGYKWLLGPYGSGFFWARSEVMRGMRPGPYYWLGAEGTGNFSDMATGNMKPTAAARKWDAAETASYFNLAGLETSLELVLRIGAEAVAAHTRGLCDLLLSRLPMDRCISGSPLEAAKRGSYVCFRARTPEKTAALYEKLRKENVYVALREGNIRVSPYMYNTEQDIDKLISVITT